MRLGTRRLRARGLRIALAIVLALPAVSPSRSLGADDTKEKDKDGVGFADPRHGNVPDGAAEMVTAPTERAIKTGLGWLARSQNADGSYGNGTYRGNIAVTSLAGLAFMASGSSPGRGPYGPNIDKALLY